MYNRKENNCKTPTYYTMKNLFDQKKNRILHLVSHMAFQAAPLISTTEPSNYVPGSSDRHV